MPQSKSKRPARGGRPTKQQSEQIAAAILEQARALFVAQGYAETTMEQVANACGAGKDTLYRRFATKEALFTAVMRVAMQRTLAWFDTVDAQSPADPIERVRHLARWFLDANLDAELLALKRDAVIEAMRVRPLFQEDPLTPRLVDAISAAQRNGALMEESADFLAAQLIAAVVLGPNNAALMGDAALSDAAARDAWFARAWALFLQGAERSPS